MKQNKGELQGVGKVFSFTFVQFAKNKANMISLIIMLVMAIFSVPVMTLFSGGGMAAGETSKIAKVYWQDETGFSVDPEQIAREDSYYKDTMFEKAASPMEEFACQGEDNAV